MGTLSEKTKGKWPSILAELGVDKQHLTGRHGPCPLCAGKDRFRFDDKGLGRWICSQCGAGDGVSLLQKIHGWDFKEAAREIERVAGTARAIPIRQGPSIDAVKAEMRAIWKGSKPLVMLDATARWWLRRVGVIPQSKDLRAVMSLRCPGAGDFPAMIALVRGVDGEVVNMHRTFLDGQGDKAPIDDARRVMPLSLPKGCAIRLTDPAATLGIAEGLETAVAATEMFGVPCWSAMTAQNMQDFAPPEGVEKVVVFGDCDASFTGQAAAYTLARKLWSRQIKVEIRIPEKIGDDWRDCWLASKPKAEETA